MSSPPLRSKPIRIQNAIARSFARNTLIRTGSPARSSALESLRDEHGTEAHRSVRGQEGEIDDPALGRRPGDAGAPHRLLAEHDDLVLRVRKARLPVALLRPDLEVDENGTLFFRPDGELLARRRVHLAHERLVAG